MASQRWHQKASVQAAIVSGVVAVLVALIGLLRASGGDIPSVEKRVATPTQVAATGKYDAVYSAESVAARRSFRAGLRNLFAGESGLKIEQLPLGTFGFAHPLLFRQLNFAVDPVPNGRLSFEVHKVSAVEVYAIAFVNADTHRKLLRVATLANQLRCTQICGKTPLTQHESRFPLARGTIEPSDAMTEGQQ